MKNKNILVGLVIILVGGTAFFGGMKYQQTKQPMGFAQFRNGQGARGPNVSGRENGTQGFQPIRGEIISYSDKGMSIKLQDGSSKIVLLSDSTTINKSSEGAKSDLKTGETVSVFGMQNTDGSITAQSVQLGMMQFRIPGVSPSNQ